MSNGVDLYLGDCLDIMPGLPGPYDMILADLPYGTTACRWDVVIPFEPLWAQYKRLIKPKGAVVLFGSQPFTSALVMSNVKWFKYCWYWDKQIPSGMSYCRFQPMRQVEELCVFSNGSCRYNAQMTERDKPIKEGGKKKSESAPIANFNHMGGKIYTHKQPVTLLSFAKVRAGTLHPTQKPVALLEYLIRTYTNEGETVLDNVMGSGSTGVACVNTGRSFVGIEKDAGHFEIAETRIAKAQSELVQGVLEGVRKWQS